MLPGRLNLKKNKHMEAGHRIIIMASVLLMSCGGKGGEEKSLAFYDSEDEVSSDSEDISDASAVSVPFEEKGGVKYVDVTVNGLEFKMIFDTGCSGTLISVAEANYLYQKGRLNAEDIIGTSKSQIADGRIVENMVVNLKEVVIGGQIECHDVEASVSESVSAPLLLGNEVLDRAASYSIDNKNKTINFKLKQE